MKTICAISGEEFEVFDLEIDLRKKFGVKNLPEIKPEYRFRELGAFWQHWNLYNRKCDKTGRDIISVFRPDCDYPVWHKDEWVKYANPPGADVDFGKPVFPQMWEFFQKSPLPNVTGTGNENCEYTDDVWFSRNCYLCHSMAHCEDVAYCYRTLKCANCYYCVFSFNLELCVDVINSNYCFQCVYVLNSKHCTDSAFLYDCRNCNNCMFCSNLRNKQYCFMNEQLTDEEYLKKRAEWDFSSRKIYEKAKELFKKMLWDESWHRALSNDKCEDITGNYNLNCKDCVNCYFCQENDQCVNCFRNYIGKTSLDFHGQTSEFCFYTILAQDKCYDIRFCSQMAHCQYMQYCAFCLNCQNCFGCAGLVDKNFYIFNKSYSEKEYYKLRDRLVEHMRGTGEYGKFFPGYFAQNPYDESWAGFYFPLNKEEQEGLGFKYKPPVERRKKEHLDVSEIPDSNSGLENFDKVYWDDVYERPFKIREADAKFSSRLGVPLPYNYYIHRLQENFRLVPFDGKLRTVDCGKCGKKIETSWPAQFDGRILCEEDYLGIVK